MTRRNSKDNSRMKIWVISSMIFILVSSSFQTPSAYKPLMISELFRHGARTAYNDDAPYILKTGIGNLTGNGQRMHFVLGQQVRENYKSLFNYTKENPVSNMDYILYSSIVQRCIISANSHLLGLFPPGEWVGDLITSEKAFTRMPDFDAEITVKFENDTKSALPLGLRVFPILTQTKSDDYIFFPGIRESCPKLRKGSEIARARANMQFKAELNITKVKLEKIGIDFEKLGGEDFDLAMVFKLFDIQR